MAEKIGNCPVCNGPVVENEKGYSCSNWKDENIKCKFTIWKNFYDKKITKTMAKSLLEKKETNKIKGWISRKTGKEFEAALKLEETPEGLRVLFKFD